MTVVLVAISLLPGLASRWNFEDPTPGPAGDSAHSLAKLPNENNRLCVVCLDANIRKKSTYWCPGCNSGIHQNCYHKLEHFWRPDKRGAKRKTCHEDNG
ncbi:hypothetical protein J6590_003877 [Homalodisca vitripennis]|nr:hypothetical protein J6590_003877 [Homalodisca vitripennis]